MTSRRYERSFPAAVARLHAAMGQVANGDIGAITALYSHGCEATSFYGWGGYEKGWDAVARRWDWAGQQFKGGTVSYRNLATSFGDAMGFTVDIETFDARLGPENVPRRWSNRVTHIFRRENGEWRLVHRHASRLEDQRAPAE